MYRLLVQLAHVAPGATDTTPNDTTETNNTPDASETPVTPKYTEPEYNEERKAAHDRNIGNINENAGIDIDILIDEVYEQYGKYLNVNITKDAVRVGIITTGTGSVSRSNLSGITPDALERVNDFLADNGEEPLDTSDHKQSIAALWLAASLFYDPSEEIGPLFPRWDIAMAFGNAKRTEPDDIIDYASLYRVVYCQLFNIESDESELR